MKNIEIVSKVVSREGEAKHSPSKNISSANLSDYLLKSIWDKVWEIRTDSQGKEYIFVKLPVVTQYGITMYSGDGVDVPSLASGLPFDGRTIWYNPDTNQIEVIGGTGGGSGEGVSNFWDLSGIPSWITNSKPKYTYSEIEGTPDLTKYALASQIPSLSGYATESWVLQKNYATKSTTLSGYGIKDAYTKTNVDDLLKTYVTLGSTQTITGEKNFTGGLKVNGSPIYYDTEKKYWKLEGDLLVTGGVTMYGSDSSFTPSTIMDAIAVDGTTISKSGGVLKVIGGTGGGVADSVAWANITGKPTWIGSSKPSYSYSEITGAISTTELQNYLTQNSYLNVTSGDNRYLKLSGGTLDGVLALRAPSSSYDSWIEFSNKSDSVVHKLGVRRPESSYGLQYYNGSEYYKIWHAGNFTPSDYLSLSGGTMNANAFISWNNGDSGNDVDNWNFINNGLRIISSTTTTSNAPVQYSTGLHVQGRYGFQIAAEGGATGGFYIRNTRSDANTWKTLIHSDNIGTYNAGSATKLQTARTIWGQSFDGSSGIDGDFTMANTKSIQGKDSSNVARTLLTFSSNNDLFIGRGSSVAGYATKLCGYSIQLCTNSDQTERVRISSSGNVGIGTPNPQDKLDVAGNIITSGGILVTRVGTGTYNKFTIGSNTTYGIEIEAPRATDSATGTALPIFIGWRGGALGIKITSGGNLLANGGITMYSDKRKKTILNHVELSLKQIADAPLIEHYYNSDDKKTTHVGSIAQYWAGLNDWFCKLDNEGYYTMEIQNAALASAISIARELDRYETKTDKAIKKLKKRICELEEEVERLKSE